MVANHAQGLVRELITGTDALSRAWYEAHDATGSGQLAALRSTLQRIERRLGRDAPMFAVEGELDLVYQRLQDLASHSERHPEGRELERLVGRAASFRDRATPRSSVMTEPTPARNDGEPGAQEMPERHTGERSAPTAFWALGAAGAMAALALSLVMAVRFVRGAR